jgi:NhaP-type Na+/H+ or K+/H+ antiporter
MTTNLPFGPTILLSESRRLRDKDRRTYRRRTILMIAYMMLTGVSVRLGLDAALNYFTSYAFLKPYAIVPMVILVIFIWIFGILVVFRRNY